MAANGGWDHFSGSTGTESRWELRRMEEREGSKPGHVTKSRGLLGARVRIWVWREREWARVWR